MPRPSVDDGSEPVITLKDARLFDKEPLDRCYLYYCQAKVDESPDRRKWTVYRSWESKFGVSYWRRLHRERGYRDGPQEYDRRRQIINRLRRRERGLAMMAG
jgi:hypothetical protein